MTVVLNEAAIRAFFANPATPLGRLLQEKADEVARLAEHNARIVMHRDPSLVDGLVDTRPQLGEDGVIEVVVSVRDRGRVSQYLLEKAERERLSGWLGAAARGETI